MDISFLVDYRRRLERALLAGIVCGLILFSGFALPAYCSGDWRKGLQWTLAGLIIAGLSLLLRKGSLMAAVSLAPAIVMGVLLTWRWLADIWLRLSWYKGTLTIFLASLVFGPIAYHLISGVEAVYTSKQSGVVAILGPAGSTPASGTDQSNRVKHENDGWGNQRTIIMQRFSEVTVLAGAGVLLASTILSSLSGFRGGVLSLIGITLLILGVNLSLHVEQVAVTQMHRLLSCSTSPTVLLLRPEKDEPSKVCARFTLRRPLVKFWLRLPFTQVIQEQAARLGLVVTVDESSTTIWQRELNGWVQTSRAIVMVMGRIESLDQERIHLAGKLLRHNGILVFPPVSFSQMRERWEDYCQQFNGAIEQSLITRPDLKRAILLVFRGNEKPLLIMSSSRDEWAYQAAFDVTAEKLQCDQH